jgi:hypothetical protein
MFSGNSIRAGTPFQIAELIFLLLKRRTRTKVGCIADLKFQLGYVTR